MTALVVEFLAWVHRMSGLVGWIAAASAQAALARHSYIHGPEWWSIPMVVIAVLSLFCAYCEWVNRC